MNQNEKEQNKTDNDDDNECLYWIKKKYNKVFWK